MEPEEQARPDDDVDALHRSIADGSLAQEIEFLAVKAFARGTRLLNERLRDLGLRARSYSVLALACGTVPVTQRELAAVLELDPSQVVALVDDLVARDLVERHTDPQDRRTRLIRATTGGDALFAEGRRIAVASEAEALARLAVSEREMLRRLLRKIVFGVER